MTCDRFPFDDVDASKSSLLAGEILHRMPPSVSRRRLEQDFPLSDPAIRLLQGHAPSLDGWPCETCGQPAGRAAGWAPVHRKRRRQPAGRTRRRPTSGAHRWDSRAAQLRISLVVQSMPRCREARRLAAFKSPLGSIMSFFTNPIRLGPLLCTHYQSPPKLHPLCLIGTTWTILAMSMPPSWLGHH